MEASGYELLLYCDVCAIIRVPSVTEWWATQYTGETRGECVRQARNQGWLISGRNKHLCPNHSGKRGPSKTSPYRDSMEFFRNKGRDIDPYWGLGKRDEY